MFLFDNITNHNCIYVTCKLCNQAFREMPKISRHFAKSLIHLGISRNAWNFQAFQEMPGFWSLYRDGMVTL